MSSAGDESKNSDTPVKSFKVKCGAKTALFFPSRLKKTGKGMSKCIKHNDKWLSPSEFESLAGMAAKKWKQSIKCEGVALGEWLTGHTLLHSQSSQSVCSLLENEAVHNQQQENATPCPCSSQATKPQDVDEIRNASTIEDNQPLSEQPDSDLECSSQVTEFQNPDEIMNASLVQNKQSHSEQPDFGLECVHVSGTLQGSPNANNEVPSLVNTGVSHNALSNVSNQGEQLNKLLTKFGLQAAPKGDGTEALLSVVVFLGEKVLQQEAELGRLKQELKVISMQHQVVDTLVPEAESKKHGNNEKPKLGKPVLARKTPPRADLTTSTSIDSCAHVTPLVRIQELQAKVELLESKQVLLDQERERNIRRCNVLLGNVPEQTGETFADVKDKVEGVFRDHLNVACHSTRVRRLGKKQEGKNRLILVTLQSKEDKVTVLRAAKALRGSGIFLMEDLSKLERERRRTLVAEMKIARTAGKKAYIRYSDGELIINGKLSTPPTTTETCIPAAAMASADNI